MWQATRGAGPLRLRRSVAAAAAAGGLAGVLIVLLGGRLMAGSLDLLSSVFPASRLSMAPIGHWFGEVGFGRVSQAATAGLEGALFSASVVGAVVWARRQPPTSANPRRGSARLALDGRFFPRSSGRSESGNRGHNRS